jgi:site-specific DNA-methyltransferase (adenine-specific)
MIEIFNNNCFDKLKEIEDNSVDLFICDLPYGSTRCKWDIKIDLDELWREMKRIARNDNTPYFFFCNMRFAIQLYNSNPKMYRYDLVWYKPNGTAGHLNSGKMPMRNHELLLVFYKKLPTYNKNEYHKKIIEPDAPNIDENFDGVYGESKQLNYFPKEKKGRWYDVKLPCSVLEHPIESKMNPKTKFHQTQKPQGILEWIIKYYSNEGQTVLDPTMGSGSTGVAAKTLNRKFIGIEMNEEYFEVAKKRLDL